MQKIKDRWEISKNWQLIHVLLGLIALLLSGYVLAKKIISNFSQNNTILLVFLTFIIAYVILNITLRLFKKLSKKWNVNYRWELIAIFLVFAITGSTSAKISGPVIEFLNVRKFVPNSILYWIIRILIVFPIYQILLVMVGWVFGQFKFFWAFEKKMLSRMGLKNFFSK
jgi:ABC-type phosphate/phosphonate transport system permease subunit